MPFVDHTPLCDLPLAAVCRLDPRQCTTMTRPPAQFELTRNHSPLDPYTLPRMSGERVVARSCLVSRLHEECRGGCLLRELALERVSPATILLEVLQLLVLRHRRPDA